MITFLLNQEIRQEVNVSPNMTVLNYLRTHVNKTGTKEGCGSGDCGACTVVLGELVDGKLEYRSVNSCLTFISALHGKQLITVEDLQARDKSLHPVQQAIVDFHALSAATVRLDSSCRCSHLLRTSRMLTKLM